MIVQLSKSTENNNIILKKIEFKLRVKELEASVNDQRVQNDSKVHGRWK